MSGNKVMIHTTTYEDLRKIILSERSQPEKKKNTYRMIPFIRNVQKRQKR